MLLSFTRMFVLLVIILFCVNLAGAQNLTTKGVEFWAAYGAHTSMYKTDGTVDENGGSQKMVFYFLCSKATNVTIEIPAINWTKKYKVIAGKTTESDEMPKLGANDTRLLTEGVSNKGIHITSDDKITAYCHIYDALSSATTILIPVNISGQEYYTLNYTQHSPFAYAHSYCFVIATENNTEIEVIPSANTINHPAGIPFTQKLNKGDVLNLFGDSLGKQGRNYIGADLTGTFIHSVNQPENDACKRIIVFSGSTSTNIMCDNDINNTSDNLFQQTPSLDIWGNYFITVPTLKMPLNKYRAMVMSPTQKVYVNGRSLTNLKGGRYYDFQTNKISSIRSDSLILLAQYITTTGQCGNKEPGIKNGDPEMIYLSPVGNGITNTIIHSTRRKGISSHFVNVVMKTADIDSFKLDGNTMPEKFTPFGKNGYYATAQIEVTPGRHALQSDSAFNAYAYGYGKLTSYGYNAGFSTRYLNGEFGVSNPYLVPPTSTVCTANFFRMYFDVEAQLVNLECKFNNNIHLQPRQDVFLTNLSPDSTYQRNDITFYRYYLPGYYTHDATGDLPVEVIAYFPNTKGCIIKKHFNFLVTVIPKPIASLSLLYDDCANNTLSFADKSVSFDTASLVQWLWDFNDGNTSSEKNPQHQFNDFGEYNLQLRTINNIGCFDDTSQLIALYPKPAADFEVSGSTCSKQDVLFKSISKVEGDELSEWRWNFPDGTVSGVQSLIKQFADSGNYEVKLITKSKHGCADTATKLLRIYQTPEIHLPPVLYTFIGDTLRLKPTYKGSIKNYNWMPAAYLSTNAVPYPLVTPAADITYNVTATAADAPCKATATTTIKLQRKLNIPSAFTPNGDGLNDTWHINNIEGYATCTVEIYNRWGNRLFYSRGYPTAWNGTYNNQPLPAGTYLYIINTHSSFNNIVQSGSVTIIR